MCTLFTDFAIPFLSNRNEIKYQKQMADYQVKIMNDQANELKRRSSDEYQKGIEESRKERLNAILKMGSVNTKAAASNLSLSSETVQNLLSDEKQKGELSAFETFDAYKQRANNYMNQANKYFENAQLKSFSSKYAYRSNRMKILNSGVQSLSNQINKVIL